MPGTDGSPAYPVRARQLGAARLSPADVSSRIVLGLVGVMAALVLWASWATVRSPYDAGLTLVIVVGLVHGILGIVDRLRLPPRPEAASYVAYGLVVALFALVTPDRLGADDASVLWTRLASGVVLAVVVHLILAGEGTRASLPGWQGFAVLALLPGCLGAVVLATADLSGTEPTGPEVQLAVDGEPVDEGPVPTVAPDGPPPALTELPATTTPVPPTGAADAGGPAAKEATAAPPGLAAPTSAPTTAAPLRPVKLLIAGDSTAGVTGTGIKNWGLRNGRAQVDLIGDGGCALQQEGAAILRDGWSLPQNPGCRQLIDYTVDAANRLQPDLIVLIIGSNQLSDWLLPGQSVANHIGEPAFDQLYSRAAAAALRKLGSLGIPILFTTTPVPAWDPAIQTGNPNTPGTGPIKMNDAGRARRLNELTYAVVRTLPLVAMAPYAERISNPDGTVPTSLRPDGVHLRIDAVPGLMDRGLEADLRSSYQQVTRRVASSRRAGHHWAQA